MLMVCQQLQSRHTACATVQQCDSLLISSSSLRAGAKAAGAAAKEPAGAEPKANGAPAAASKADEAPAADVQAPDAPRADFDPADFVEAEIASGAVLGLIILPACPRL